MPKRTQHADAAAFGAVIRRLRTDRGWTIAALARKLGMNATHLGVLERGENIPSLLTILSIARSLGVPASAIFAAMERRAEAEKIL